MTWRDDITAHLESVERDFAKSGIEVSQESLTKVRDDENARHLMRAYAAFWLRAKDVLRAADRGDLDDALENMESALAALWRGQGWETSELGQQKQAELAEGKPRRERTAPESLEAWIDLVRHRTFGWDLPQYVWDYLDEVAFSLAAMIDNPPPGDANSPAVMRALQLYHDTQGRSAFTKVSAFYEELEFMRVWYDTRDENPDLLTTDIDKLVADNKGKSPRQVQRNRLKAQRRNEGILGRRDDARERDKSRRLKAILKGL